MKDAPEVHAHDGVLVDARLTQTTLADALAAAFGDAAAIGLVTSAHAFAWLRFGRAGIGGADAEMASHAYEARFFNADLELRWRRGTRGGALGIAVAIAEDATRLPSKWARSPAVRDLVVLPNRYLIWGIESGEVLPHGIRLRQLPSGTGWLPVAPNGSGEVYQLCTREYFGCADGDAYGNVAALDERWTHIEAAAKGHAS